jgi:hypothetical protein
MATAPHFNEAAINSVFDQVVSLALQLGRFEQVNQHEPKNAPANGITCAVWVDDLVPISRSSLDAISGALILMVRIYTPFQQQPYDMIDPSVITAVSELMGAFAGDFDFGNVADVRCVDILGGEGSGQKMRAKAGYLEISRNLYRVMTLTLPIIVNDMWTLGG